MTKDHRMTAGRYGTKGVRLTRDDFASIVYTLVPAETPSPAELSEAEPAAPVRTAARPATGTVPAEVLTAGRGHCAALAEAWPDEPIATLAESVAVFLEQLDELPTDAAGNVLYAAALLCDEEAALSGAASQDGDVATRLKDAAKSADARAGASAVAAFDD